MPASFVAVSENTNGPNYIREAVLKGETVDRWTQMITVTGAKGFVSNPKETPRQRRSPLRDRSSSSFRSACPDTFAAKGFGPTKFAIEH